MGDNTAIEWTDSTWNPWIGCTKVGPGCDHCYAEALMDTRHHRAQWGAGQPRVRTSADNWKAPLAWNARPFFECLDCSARFAPPVRGEGFITCPSCGKLGGRKAYDEADGARVKQVRRRVFCASLADVFDNEVDPAWRRDLFDLIELTPNLDWLLLTKRIGNVAGMVTKAKSGDWLAARPNVWLGATMVNRGEMLRDAEKLKEVPARVLFWSVEPMLGDLGPIPPELMPDWVIAGGESGPKARPVHPDWVRSLRDQCQAAGVPFLFKQWGEWAPYDRGRINLSSGALDDPIQRFGKKLAGRTLDGRTWDGFPGAA